MALKLTIGFQKKLGQPDYGSLGASCMVEFEVDSSLLHNDLDGFHQKARHAFVACQQAVSDQLARQAQNGADKNGNGHANGHPPPPAAAASPTNGSNGQGNSGGTSRMATQSQARAIRAIASKQRLDLQKLLEARFGVGRPENLRLADASSLIDEMKNSGDEGGGQR